MVRRVATLVLSALLAAASARAQEPLRFVGDRDYPPLSYLENGEPRGFDVDILREIGRIIGRDIRIDLMEWAEAQRLVQSGDATGLTDLAISDERRALYDFADTTVTHDFGLFVRDGDTTTGTLTGLRGKAVGVTAGGFPREFFASRPDVRLVLVDNYDAGFDRLLEGTIDAMAADVWAGASTVEARGLKGVVLGGEPFASLPAAIAIRKGHAALLQQINAAIRQLDADGTLASARRRWAPHQLVFLSRERIQTLVVSGLGIALALLLAGTTAWALTLRRQIAVRRAVEGQLRESGQRLALALGAANMGTWRVSFSTQQDTRDAVLNRMLGLEAIDSTVDADDIFERVHPDDRQAMREEFAGAIRERRGYLSEFRIIRPDGEIRWLRGRGKAVYLESGAPDYATGVAVDISDEVAAEEARRRFGVHLRQAAEVNKLLLAEMDLEGLSPAVVEAAHKILAIDYAVLLVTEPGNAGPRLAAQRGLAGAGQAPSAGQAIAASTLAADEMQLLGPAELERCGATVAPLVEAGLRSLCSLPLVTSRETVGVLIIGSTRLDAFTNDDLTLMQQLATYVAIAIQNARAYHEIRTLKDQVSREKLYLEEEIRLDHNFADIVGESAAIRRVLQQIETVAPTAASVLLLGETGTGKELLARALHRLSPRKERTFVRVNAAALPTTLLESELFGYERGAFTGATTSKMGRMELAHRGTLFLDEIGDVPLEVQPKLLRVLQEREFERLGSSRTQQVDVRFVAATNRDLQQMVDDGTFRSDLFYRLNVFPVQIPPLRERRDDIPALVRYFVQRFATQFKRRVDSIPLSAMTMLQDWHWPGNIRELENVIERAVIVSNDGVLHIPAFEDFPAVTPFAPSRMTDIGSPDEASPGRFRDAERDMIVRALRDAQGVVAGAEGAAARLGIKRTTLQSKMRKLGIRRPSF